MSKTSFLLNFEKDLAEREFDPRETVQWLYMDKLLPMSWGFRNPKNLLNKGFMFTVSGFLHKGHVLITLGWNDTYTVRLFNNHYNQVGEAYEGIYCDMLADFIDRLVETK